jgi:hypothetical protein
VVHCMESNHWLHKGGAERRGYELISWNIAVNLIF